MHVCGCLNQKMWCNVVVMCAHTDGGLMAGGVGGGWVGGGVGGDRLEGMREDTFVQGVRSIDGRGVGQTCQGRR
jgi:hypothetical protein